MRPSEPDSLPPSQFLLLFSLNTLIPSFHLTPFTGPIVPTQPYTSIADAIQRANDTNTGLGACVWSADVEQAQQIASQLQAGTVYINSYEKPAVQAAFGGVKESGVGYEWGPKGWMAYTVPKAVHVYKTESKL